MEVNMKKVNIAVVGATGMVGRTFLKVLEERDLPYNKIYCYASKRSAGMKVKCKGEDIIVEELIEASFDRDIDIALFSAGGATSEKFAPIAASKGVIVIDNSSHFRMDEDVPLVVPEVNPQAIWQHKNIIANPNCSTIQAMVALKPLQEKYGLERVIISTYQAVSGSGVKGMTDLEEGLKGNHETIAYPHPIANNCLPHIDVFMDNGYTKEEMKMIDETKKILDDANLKVTTTAVRVPLYDCHSESINVELSRPFEIEDIFELFRKDESIVLQDDPSNNVYPLATTAKGTDEVYIGRIRRDFSLDNGINIWVVADNIRKGAASNAIQIAEVLINR